MPSIIKGCKLIKEFINSVGKMEGTCMKSKEKLNTRWWGNMIHAKMNIKNNKNAQNKERPIVETKTKSAHNWPNSDSSHDQIQWVLGWGTPRKEGTKYQISPNNQHGGWLTKPKVDQNKEDREGSITGSYKTKDTIGQIVAQAMTPNSQTPRASQQSLILTNDQSDQISTLIKNTTPKNEIGKDPLG